MPLPAKENPPSLRRKSHVITKEYLAAEAGDLSGHTCSQMEKLVQCLIDSIIAALAEGKTVKLHNFGVFRPLVRRARLGRVPEPGGREIPIPERTEVKFEAGRELRERVAALLPPGVAANTSEKRQ